jgi:hypothetical protein
LEGGSSSKANKQQNQMFKLDQASVEEPTA